MTVTAVAAHTYVDFRGALQYVWSACGTEIVAWVCLTHDLDFPTKSHLAAHVKQDGDHLVGRLCTHGLEAPSPKQQREPGEEAA